MARNPTGGKPIAFRVKFTGGSAGLSGFDSRKGFKTYHKTKRLVTWTCCARADIPHITIENNNVKVWDHTTFHSPLFLTDKWHKRRF
jgi:hypothetical protein